MSVICLGWKHAAEGSETRVRNQQHVQRRGLEGSCLVSRRLHTRPHTMKYTVVAQNVRDGA